MPHSKTSISIISFLLIWTIWSTWTALNPNLDTAQIAILIPLLPLSAVLLAFSFFDNGDDDQGGGGLLQPIYQKIK